VPALGATRAAAVQLTVPALAACAGVALLGEQLTARLVGSAALTIGGVALAVLTKGRASRG
jgi:drug/metabolite transporter (DMT)-like permease